MLRAVQQGEFRAAASARPDDRPALEAVCLKAMAPSAGGPLPFARALAEDVERWMADEPVASYPEPVAAKLGRSGRRHKSAVAATVVALSISAVVLSLAAISQARTNERLAQANREAGDRLIRARTGSGR